MAAHLFPSASSCLLGPYLHPQLQASKRHQGHQGPPPDYYKALGVSPSATPADIKKAYKQMALKYHPDRNKDPGAEDKFKEAAAAYRVLSNENEKRQYDMMRGVGGGGRPGGMPGGGGGTRPPGAGGGMPGFGGGEYPGSFRTTFTGPNIRTTRVHMSRNEADQMFRDAFGQSPLDQIFRDFQQSGAQTTRTTTFMGSDGKMHERKEQFVKDAYGNTYRVQAEQTVGGFDPRAQQYQQKFQRENPFERASATNEDAFRRPEHSGYGGGQQQQSQQQQQWANNPFGNANFDPSQAQRPRQPGEGTWNPFDNRHGGTFGQGFAPVKKPSLAYLVLYSLIGSFFLTLFFTVLISHPFIFVFIMLFLLLRARPF